MQTGSQRKSRNANLERAALGQAVLRPSSSAFVGEVAYGEDRTASSRAEVVPTAVLGQASVVLPGLLRQRDRDVGPADVQMHRRQPRPDEGDDE